VSLIAALTIAGSDPSGGAGLQADLKTFHQFGVYGEAAVTLLTVQNTKSVLSVEFLHPDMVCAQVRAVVEDIPPAAAKTGALGSAAIVEAVAQLAASWAFPLVVDPVMISKHGAPLMAAEARAALAGCLLPLCRLVTPNLHEAGELAGMEVSTPEAMRSAAIAIYNRTGAAVLVKGGHLVGEALDLLFDGAGFQEFISPRVSTVHTHGTGCTYSAAITACLALGMPLAAAVGRAKSFIARAIATNPGLGGGSGPVNHFAPTTMEGL
jgi:hydroxymethylpyrimidine/phosphomethylpyrimidine kinase